MQRLHISQSQLVLGSARQSNLTRQLPNAASLNILGRVHNLSVLADTATAYFFNFLHNVQLNAGRVIHIAVRVTHGNNLHALGLRLLNGIDSHVAGAGNDSLLALQSLVVMTHHFFQHINQTVTGGLSTAQRTAKGQTFTGQHALINAGQTLILTKQITDLSTAYTNITGRYITVSADIFIQLGHKALAEMHNLAVGFTLRVEIGAAFAAANRQTGQRIFESLLKAQKFQNALVNRGMKTQTTLIRPNGAVKLNTIATVYAHDTVVIQPRYTESNAALGFNHALQQSHITVILFMHGNSRLNRIQNLLNCLAKLRLVCVFLYHVLINLLCVRH